jgi:hypothetical protein
MDYSVKELIDEAFYVEQSNWKTWKSYDKDGKPLVTSLTTEDCVAATRYYLKLKQEGILNDIGVSYSSVVDGKL